MTDDRRDTRLSAVEQRQDDQARTLESLAPMAVHVAEIRVAMSELGSRIDRQHEWLAKIEAHTSATNGRVSKLELWQARMDGARWAFSWLPSLVTAVIASVVSVVATALILT